MPGLIFGPVSVTHHCKREAETGFEAVVTGLAATEGNQLAATMLVQGCVGMCRSVCPEGCEMRILAGLTQQQMQAMLRLSEI